MFFIDTATGRVSTHRQLIAAGLAETDQPPPRPWHRVQGPGDASTMWYAVLRKRERGVYIGTLTIRHGDHHAFLLERGWEDVPIEEIRESQAI
jgi:hypothetical protein